MDKSNSSYASLLQTAKAQHDAGNLKGAYATYLKAHATITHTLDTQFVFKDQASLESMPNNYLQLFAHAEEIIRRMKDIAEQATNRSRVSVAPSSGSSKQTNLSVSQQAPAIRPKLTASTSSQRSIATHTTHTTSKRTKKNIPMIPLSPLTRQSLLNSYALSQVNQRLEQAKQAQSAQKSPAGSGTRDLANLRRLIEDVRIQRAKLDAVNTQIQSVTDSTITSWDPDTIARQLTIIDASLFKNVAIPRDLVRADRKVSAAQHCIDFENYIAHSTAHLLLLEWSASRQASPDSSPVVVSKGQHPRHPTNAVAHMIRVAHILLHVYRNFNSFRAVMRALTSPEVKRMHKLWSGVSSKTKDAFRRLVSIYQEQGNAASYKEMLVQKLDAFQDVGKGALVAIPWMRYHQDEVKSIIQSYLTGHESVGGSSDIVLSAPGARKLSAVTAILLQCRTNESGNFDRADREDSSTQSLYSNHREPVQMDGLKTPLAPIWDLVSLGTGEVTLHHWFLTRPFLNKQQLIDESLEIEPLFNGEELPCYSTPLDDEDSGDESISRNGNHIQDDSFEHVIAPEHDLEPLPETALQSIRNRSSSTRSPVSEADIDDIMNELLNDDSSDGKGLFDDSDADETSEQPPNQTVSKESPGRSRDILQFLGIDPEDDSDNNDGNNSDSDFVQSISKLSKGKGKPRDHVEDEEEEISELMAKVKGLVHESRAFADDVESTQPPATELGSIPDNVEQEGGADNLETELPTISPSRTFEPFQEGNEEDEFGFSNNPQANKADDTPHMSSLEALRRQLQAHDLEHHADLALANNTDSDSAPAAIEDGTPKEETSRGDGIVDETAVDIHVEPSSKPDSVSAIPSAASASPTTLSSIPAAPSGFIASHMTRIPAELLEVPPLTIGNARRRKIEKDRSLNTDELDEEDDEVKLEAKDPLHRISAPEITDCSMADAIIKKENKDEGNHASPIIHIHDLENTSLNSSQPFSETSTSALLLSSTTAATKTTTTTVTTTSIAATTTMSTRIAANDSGAAPFKLGENLFESRSDRALTRDVESLIGENDNRSQKDISLSASPEGGNGRSPGQEGGDEGAVIEADLVACIGDKSPDDAVEGRGRSHNRQRRRIAGGVISLPTNNKGLSSKASTSSLSNAHINHGLGQQQKDNHRAEEGNEQGGALQDAAGQTASLESKDVTEDRLSLGDVGDDHGSRKKSSDIVTKTAMSKVDVDVTASEVHSLMTKTPPVATETEKRNVDDVDRDEH